MRHRPLKEVARRRAFDTIDGEIDEVSYHFTEEGGLTNAIHSLIKRLLPNPGAEAKKPVDVGDGAPPADNAGLLQGDLPPPAEAAEMVRAAEIIADDLSRVPTYLADDAGAIFYSKISKLVAEAKNRQKPDR